MNKFSCFVCEKRFSNESEIIKHLKIIHNVKDRTMNLKCAVSSECTKTYTTFKCFKEHISKCDHSMQVVKILFDCKLFELYIILCKHFQSDLIRDESPEAELQNVLTSFSQMGVVDVSINYPTQISFSVYLMRILLNLSLGF